MLDPKQLDELSRRVAEILPPGMREVQQDFDKNLHSVLQSVFTRFDLVTRKEFEVQSAVLIRTREKVEALEAKVSSLEQQLSNK